MFKAKCFLSFSLYGPRFRVNYPYAWLKISVLSESKVLISCIYSGCLLFMLFMFFRYERFRSGRTAQGINNGVGCVFVKRVVSQSFICVSIISSSRCVFSFPPNTCKVNESCQQHILELLYNFLFLSLLDLCSENALALRCKLHCLVINWCDCMLVLFIVWFGRFLWFICPIFIFWYC